MIVKEQFSLSMDSQQQQQQLQQHHQQQRNSKHANTSSSVVQVATAATSAAMMATATQMRATLIYLAPFLHPCKNVVPGTTTTTSSGMLSSTQQHQHNLPAEWDGEKDVEILQKTHVARVSATTSSTVLSSTASRSSIARRGGGVASNSCSTSTCNSNRNVTTMSTNMLLHPGGHNNHYNNAINCNSTVINASTGVRHGSSNTNNNNNNNYDIGSSSIRSSCCHHNNAATERQDLDMAKLQWPESKENDYQTKNPKTTKKDNAKCYENYEMPALETTTTMFASANNKIRHQKQLQEQQPETEQRNKEGHLLARMVVVDAMQNPNECFKKTADDNPSLSATTSINSSHSSTTTLTSNMSGMVPSTKSSLQIQQDKKTTTSSFVNYTNSRSTKYLRERGRRHHHQQQQQQGHDSTLGLAPVGQPLKKKHEEFQQFQQRRNSPCGRHSHSDPCSNAATTTTTTTTAAATPTTSAVVFDNHNTAKCCNNNQMTNTSLLSRCHCLNNMLSNASVEHSPASRDHHGGQEDGHHDLILRNSLEACNSSSNAIGNEIFYTLNDNNVSPTPSASSSSLSPPLPQPSTSSSSSSASISTSTSYTTILNKECRCFNKNKRDIIIGSEKLSKNAASTTATATTPPPPASGFMSCCIINSNADSSNTLSMQHSLDLSSTTTTLSSASSMDSSAASSSATSSSSSTSSSFIATASSSLSSVVPCWWWCWLVALFGCSKLTKTVTVSKWLFMWLLFVVLSSSAHCWAGRNDVPTNCTFPAHWEGSWFLSGYQQSIHIKGSQFSYRGRCAASDGNKYLIVDEKGCHRCLVIYEKHKNVLQYKESECEGDSMYMHQTNPSAMAMRSVLNQKPSLGNGGDHRGGAHPNLNGHSRLSSSDQYIMRSNDDMNDYFCKGRETLQNLCDQIPGDALLYSLFRESAEPVKCPLKGPFVFTYNRGNGECKSPVSNIESCTEDSRLLLSFQACPDVVGTESTVEELTCLATWKDGNSRYLVGLVSHHHAISNEERYRCFVYEKISSLMDMGHFGGPSMSTSKDAEYKLAQSGDATCNGLDSAEVGSRIMSLRKPPVTERCDFPAWFKGPRHWHVLMGNAVYNYHSNDGSIHIIKPNGYMDTRALCEQINKQTATEMMSVVHYTTGCQSGFMCMMFYRRDTHIIEIQTGKPASRLEDACAPDHFDINKTPYITLLASNPDPQICPMEGLYTLRGAIGPPYMATRHKRNHNNKVHGIHNHHHQYESNERGLLHRRHASLSFRNSNPNERNAWHSNTRGLPGRSRRDASSTTTQPTTSTLNSSQVASSAVAAPASASPKDVTTQEILVVGNNTNVGFVQDPDSDNRLRSRRNVPECITNYKAQRQLWIGCTEPNVIDVRPLCNDEGDEEYSCHGSWTENGTVYIIARHKGTKHGVCISYRPTEGNNAKLVVGDACYRGTQKPPEHHLEANLSVFGKCGETGNTSATTPIFSWLHLMATAVIITLLSQFTIPR
ncbi:argus isoform X2 [Musca autumnalis]|uniref:argus isoform X2 n=1 Tax=Musca autumnalis TaxID=221902 RepID=UPI003CF425B4